MIKHDSWTCAGTKIWFLYDCCVATCFVSQFFNVVSNRYVTKSLEAENVSSSYVGVFLLKEYSVAWIKQVKDLLSKCNVYLKSTFVDAQLSATELQNTAIILLHTMVSLTSANTWRIFNASPLPENLRVLKPGINQLCKNTVGSLLKEDFYVTLKVLVVSVNWFLFHWYST